MFLESMCYTDGMLWLKSSLILFMPLQYFPQIYGMASSDQMEHTGTFSSDGIIVYWVEVGKLSHIFGREGGINHPAQIWKLSI